ncbi:hypothetical protein EDC04DRAFT_2906190 [Pisolithus marmoratus]|nr:hypothetical protein EDC04DRAFT_2906190 [Pisolithus marmoratus]
MQHNADDQPPRPASSLGRLSTARGQKPFDSGVNDPALQPEQAIQGSSASPQELRRSSLDSSAAAPNSGSSAAEPYSTTSRSSCTVMRSYPMMASRAKPESIPLGLSSSTESSRTSPVGSGIKSRTILEPVSLFPIDESYLPSTKPPPPRKLHKRAASALTEAPTTPRPRSAGASSVTTERPKHAFFSPTHRSHTRRSHSSTSIRPHTVCEASEISLQTPGSEQSLDSPEYPSPVSSTRHGNDFPTCESSTHFDRSDWTWTPPDSWSGPQARKRGKSTECSQNSHKTRPRNLLSWFVRVSPSSWNLSFSTLPTENSAPKRSPVKKEPPGRQELIVTVEGKDGMSTQPVYEVIPQLRALKGSRR